MVHRRAGPGRRPGAALAATAGPGGFDPARDRWINPDAFANPAPYTFGNAGWGILEGPGLFTADLGVHRTFPVKEAAKITLRWEMFNAFNRANFNNPNAVVGSSAAGTVSATYPSRSMQLGLKATF